MYIQCVPCLLPGCSKATAGWHWQPAPNSRRLLSLWALMAFSRVNFSFFLRAFANCERRILASSCLSVCLSVCHTPCLPVLPYVRMEQLGIPLDGFSWNLIFEYFSKIFQENSSFTKIWQEQRVLYVKANIHLWYLVQLFFETRNAETKSVQKIKTHVSCSVNLFIWISCPLWGKV